jgi:hypothetical protein
MNLLFPLVVQSMKKAMYEEGVDDGNIVGHIRQCEEGYGELPAVIDGLEVFDRGCTVKVAVTVVTGSLFDLSLNLEVGDVWAPVDVVEQDVNVPSFSDGIQAEAEEEDDDDDEHELGP